MSSIVKIVGCSVLLAASVLAQEKSPANQAELLINQVKKTVVFVHKTLVLNGVQRSFDGTAFFISQSDPLLKDSGTDWVVTNKHMLRQPLPNGSPGPFFKEVELRMNTLTTAAEKGAFVERPLPVTDGAGDLLWCTDSDDTVDLAVLQVAPNYERIDALAVPTDNFRTSELSKKLNVNENDDVLFAGLFAPYHGLRRNFPIVRHGKLALVSDERIPVDARNPHLSEEIILVEVTSFGGNSGSPVFLRIAGIREGSVVPTTGFSYYLLGVMQGFFSEATQFSLELTPLFQGTVQQNSGIAAVIPASRILKILQSPRARALTLFTAANLKVKEGNYPEAERLFRECISMSEQATRPDHPDLIHELESYADLLRKQNRDAEAIKLEARARAIRTKCDLPTGAW